MFSVKGAKTHAVVDSNLVRGPNLLVRRIELSFWDAIQICLTKFSTFSGRGSRAEYWQFVLATSIVLAIAGAYSVTVSVGEEPLNPWPSFIPFVCWIVLFIPLMAAAWRRMHDVGRAGWEFLLSQLFAMVVLLFPALLAYFLGEFLHTQRSVLLLAKGRVMVDQNVWVTWVYAAAIVYFYFVPFWWLTRPSQPGPNKYGPNPIEVTP